MNWDAVGAIGEVVAAVGVVVSLLYLGMQFRSYSRATIGETEREVIQSWDDAIHDSSSTPEAARLMRGGFEGLVGLNPDERFFFVSRMSKAVMAHYKIWRMAQKNLVDHSVVAYTDALIADWLASPGGRVWLSLGGLAWSPSNYREHLNALVKEADPDAILVLLSELDGIGFAASD